MENTNPNTQSDGHPMFMAGHVSAVVCLVLLGIYSVAAASAPEGELLPGFGWLMLSFVSSVVAVIAYLLVAVIHFTGRRQRRP